MTTTPACVDRAELDAILARYPSSETSLIPILQDVQRTYRYLPCDALTRVAETLHVPLARIFSVATFYRAFALSPRGKVVVRICTGTACHVRGAGQILAECARRLHVNPGDTTVNGEFTLETVNCVGACAMAPVVLVGERYHGHVKASRVAGIFNGGARS